MKTKTIEAMPGNTIDYACREAVAMAMNENCIVEFDFNGQQITARPDSVPAVLAKAYMDECQRAHDAYVASDEYKQQQAEYERREREKKEAVDGLLKDRPEHMTLRDPQAWKEACDKNTDSYGGGVMTFAERWARLMEARMEKDEKLSDIADDCSHLADIEGITGFMYGCAVSILARVWTHGEELRRWHNLKTQLRNEGERANETSGVLNPALLNIG